MDVECYVSHRHAKEQAGATRAFYNVLLMYAVVNAGLFVIDSVTPGGPWFFWPLLGWGIGMLIFGERVCIFTHRSGRDWEERKIREIMKLKKESF